LLSLCVCCAVGYFLGKRRRDNTQRLVRDGKTHPVKRPSAFEHVNSIEMRKMLESNQGTSNFAGVVEYDDERKSFNLDDPKGPANLDDLSGILTVTPEEPDMGLANLDDPCGSTLTVPAEELDTGVLPPFDFDNAQVFEATKPEMDIDMRLSNGQTAKTEIAKFLTERQYAAHNVHVQRAKNQSLPSPKMAGKKKKKPTPAVDLKQVIGDDYGDMTSLPESTSSRNASPGIAI